MTMPDISDWQTPVAPTSKLIGVLLNTNFLAGSIRIDGTLIPQATGVAISIVFKPGNASSGVLWFVQDVTLARSLTLGTVFDAGNPGMQVRPFAGAYVLENPGNDVEVEFATVNAGVIVADIYVYALCEFPVVIAQVGLNGFTGLQSIAPVTVAAGATTTILATPGSGRINRILTLFANHVTAAAAVTRVSWVAGIGGQPFLTTFDTAVANFVWINFGPFDMTNDLVYVNGSSQPHQVGVGFQVGPE